MNYFGVEYELFLKLFIYSNGVILELCKKKKILI